jgi:endoglucanase
VDGPAPSSTGSANIDIPDETAKGDRWPRRRRSLHLTKEPPVATRAVRRSFLRAACVLTGAAAVLGVCVTPASAAQPAGHSGGPHRAGPGHTLSAGTTLAQLKPDRAARRQIHRLRAAGDRRDARLVRDMVTTPQAYWLDGGSPKQTRRAVAVVAHRARAKRSVPVFVVYDVPGRDCSQYSSGGAGSDAAYRSWIDAVVRGLGDAHAIVIVEPDGLANLPSDCPSAYPGQDVTALTAARIADIRYAATRLENGDANSLVYLDAGHSAWHSVGDMAQRLDQAGVADVQGFFLNVSNYQFTPNLDAYGTWISDCLAYATDLNSQHQAVAAGDWGNCGDQYWNGGPANGWNGVPMNNYGRWSATASDPALNTSGVDSRYAQELGSVTPLAHFVVDTSRNGRGPNDMSAYGQPPYNQPDDVVTALRNGNWCNPPGAALGVTPQVLPDAGVPLLDAYLWVKTPGQSDGQCNIAGGARAWDYDAYDPWHWNATQQQQNDPLWGRRDPAAGAWFPAQALQLARLAAATG